MGWRLQKNGIVRLVEEAETELEDQIIREKDSGLARPTPH